MNKLIKSNSKQKSFNDGIAYFYNVENNIVDDTSKKKYYFENEVIGFARYEKAKATDQTITKLISIPYTDKINIAQQVKIKNLNYSIIQIQEIFDSMPKSCKISLQRMEE